MLSFTQHHKAKLSITFYSLTILVCSKLELKVKIRVTTLP